MGHLELHFHSLQLIRFYRLYPMVCLVLFVEYLATETPGATSGPDFFPHHSVDPALNPKL